LVVIETQNVHSALPKALKILREIGIERNSRNGPVRMAPCPVTTVYQNPCERVIFWPERDANPFLHLYESMWMLAGRNDIKPLLRYTANMEKYSDDGVTLHGAYGYRWRQASHGGYHYDQLAIIAEQLKADPNDRRCVLQMWSADIDLGNHGKDVPCNVMATFQRDCNGALDMTVFCRSNDIIWGAYGANAVHFSFLLEYMAIWIGCPVGVYRQISVNWHAYVDVLKTVDPIADELVGLFPYFSVPRIRHLPMYHDGDIKALDRRIEGLLMLVDSDFRMADSINDDEPFFDMAADLFMAHHLWKTQEAPRRYIAPLHLLETLDQNIDWVIAAREWIQRRYDVWSLKHNSAGQVISRDKDEMNNNG
jgi:thymidylate synthase